EKLTMHNSFHLSPMNEYQRVFGHVASLNLTHHFKGHVKNEWIKHGSCAACKEGMNSPTRYFQVSLKLRRHFNIDKILNTAGIVPSCNNPYKGREVWFQVKIYLYQNFTLGCHTYDQEKLRDAHTLWSSSSGHPCPQQGPVFYFPIKYEDPLHPCD
uniref:Uncharacterized protein n=1 Tax=Scleropages formosus TaxID=113540 RepID=A0A8C9WT06_SCLFO